ncbi:MAG: heme-binding protein [Dehalococcoidales bacterium]|nr:heme-binding protein [Dehalococcoidales bacterium]
MRMSLEIAKKMLLAGREEAQSLGILCSITIVDENGWLVALHRMDGAPIPTVDIARDKAWTAAAFKLPSSDVSRFGTPEMSGLGLNAQNWNDRLTTIPGGLPVEDGDEVIAGVGVCGGTPQQDVAVCQAAIAAIHS